MNTTSKNLDGYGTPPIEWERVHDVLTSEITQAPDTGGPPPWYVYKITPATVFAFGTAEPYGATRFDLT